VIEYPGARGLSSGISPNPPGETRAIENKREFFFPDLAAYESATQIVSLSAAFLVRCSRQ